MNTQRIVFTAAITSMLVACANLKVELPDPPGEQKNQWATQGWTNADRHWYHHAEQGTNTFGLPVEWFKALEQPDLSAAKPGLFSDQEYLARFGFIKSPRSVVREELSTNELARYGYTAPAQKSTYSGYSANAENLPVGFGVGGDWLDSERKPLPIPGTNRNARSFGLTCAACHTGQLEYNGHRILIDGGASLISLDKIREALKLSFEFTLLPERFHRFARNVLGPDSDLADRIRLRIQFDKFLLKAVVQGKLEEKQARKDGALIEGFARLDALNRIGNEVFAGQMELPENMYPITAPVSYPPIWNAPWFDWVQYNSSIQQPMVRNIGEAMGVKGKVNLADKTDPFRAYIPVEHLQQMETLLAGEARPWEARKFGGLQSPRWADFAAQGILPPLDQKLVEQGRNLYMEGDPAKNDAKKGLCVGCHLPPIDSPDIFRAEYWQQPAADADADYRALANQLKPVDKFLALVTIPVMEIGTDCRTAYSMVYRTVTTPGFIGNSGKVAAPFQSSQIPADCPQPASVAELSSPSFKAKDGFVVTNFGYALGEVVGKVKNAWYASTGKTAQERLALDGYRPNGIRGVAPNDYYPNPCPASNPPYARADAQADARKGCPNPELPSYRARPLNGVWATAPFLHNGSVPNLYLLLGSQAERDAQAGKFYVGSRAYDPVYAGYRYRTGKGVPECAKVPEVAALDDTRGLFELDTTIGGNRNTGHLFSGDKSTRAAGVIGRALTCDERFAIIEYLKSL